METGKALDFTQLKNFFLFLSHLLTFQTPILLKYILIIYQLKMNEEYKIKELEEELEKTKQEKRIGGI